MDMYSRMQRKRIPYGMMNFVDIREGNCYYVDKTRFIEEVEESNRFFFFIRPRRFGKSLTMSMLQHYYDVNEAGNFEAWFKGLYIYDHPTAERGRYLVAHLNFAVVNAEADSYRKSLDAHCSTHFNAFCDRYARFLPADVKEGLNQKDGAAEQLDYLAAVCAKAGLEIYLFIDEYDHFTNKILSEPDCLKDYMSETHGTGYLRNFFDTVKAATYTSVKRVFITGVSPVTLDDLTSGFNIGTNYSLNARFNEMVGFTQQEVREMLAYYSSVTPFHHGLDELIGIMKPWYDNYCFAEEAYGETTMYNSNMVLFFLYNYIDNQGRVPRHMIEENIRVDYNKLRMLIRRDKEFAHDASVIQQLVTEGFVAGDLKAGFPAESIGTPDNFISLLYYFGMVTISGTHKGKTKFSIPNEVVREQLFTYLLDTYKENDLAFESHEKANLGSQLAYDGAWLSYFQQIADALRRFASQRDRQKGEAFVHGFTLAMTCQCRYYRPISELDNQGGYADIFLSPLKENYPDLRHSYVVELKYVRASATDAEVERMRGEAASQVTRYADSDTVRRLAGRTCLHKIVALFRGMDMAVCEEVD